MWHARINFGRWNIREGKCKRVSYNDPHQEFCTCTSFHIIMFKVYIYSWHHRFNTKWFTLANKTVSLFLTRNKRVAPMRVISTYPSRSRKRRVSFLPNDYSSNSSCLHLLLPEISNGQHSFDRGGYNAGVRIGGERESSGPLFLRWGQTMVGTWMESVSPPYI